MAFIEVPGADLYHESLGSGPVLILIPGATGTADSFRLIASMLSERYTVIAYDRRGFSRSRLTGSQDYARRLETDADDVRRLIDAAANGPAAVLGVSAGGIVALEALARHGDVIRVVVALEPPLVLHLPDGQRISTVLDRIHDLYVREGPEIAMAQWRAEGIAFTNAEVAAFARAARLGMSSPNTTDLCYWFEHELRQYPTADPDLDVLAAHRNKIVLAVGRESEGYPAHEAGAVVAEKLGATTARLPGGHGGYLTRPKPFARELMGVLGDTHAR